MFQPLARLIWEKAEGQLVDQRFLKQGAYQSDGGGRTSFQVWEYMLDVPTPDGNSVRLTTEEKSFWLPTGLKVGDRLPVLVNGKRTKVAIDRKALTDHSDAVRDARERIRKAGDEARFKARQEVRDDEEALREVRKAEDEVLSSLGETGDVAVEVREDLESDRELEDQMKEDEAFLRKHSQD